MSRNGSSRKIGREIVIRIIQLRMGPENLPWSIIGERLGLPADTAKSVFRRAEKNNEIEKILQEGVNNVQARKAG